MITAVNTSTSARVNRTECECNAQTVNGTLFDSNSPDDTDKNRCAISLTGWRPDRSANCDPCFFRCEHTRTHAAQRRCKMEKLLLLIYSCEICMQRLCLRHMKYDNTYYTFRHFVRQTHESVHEALSRPLPLSSHKMLCCVFRVFIGSTFGRKPCRCCVLFLFCLFSLSYRAPLVQNKWHESNFQNMHLDSPTFCWKCSDSYLFVFAAHSLARIFDICVEWASYE